MSAEAALARPLPPPAALREPRSTALATAGRVTASAAVVTGLVLLSIFILAPLVILFIYAFANTWYPPALLPQSYTLSWWHAVFMAPGLGESIVLSFTFAPVVTLASALVCLPAAYAFSRYRFPGRRLFQVSIFAISAFPTMGIFITLAQLFYSLHLNGTFPGVVVVQTLGRIVPMTWIPTAAFSAVPRELEDAARDNGAGPLRTFLQITVPHAFPGILIALILTFIGSLDEAQGTFLVGVPHFETMPVIMYSLVSGYPAQSAAVFSILLTIPSLILLLVVRRYIVSDAFASAFRLR
jgi:putative spermidine/putrescine transport system permease protein